MNHNALPIVEMLPINVVDYKLLSGHLTQMNLRHVFVRYGFLAGYSFNRVSLLT